ncbi:MAG TPA: C13 family peptidase [Steroidobacteraceae bacterium]|nr:C13 family peptidase [Steroidobacteraceae bacterium]
MNDPATHIDSPPQAWRTALLRLWLLKPVRSAPSGNPLRPTLIMAAAWLSSWVAIDRWQSQPKPQFFPGGIPLLAWYVLAILGLGALLWSRARPAPAFGSAVTLAMGAVPVPLVFASVVALYLDPAWFLGAAVIVGLYTLLYLARGLHALTGQTQRAAACAGLLFLVGFGWLTDRLDVIPDVWTPLEAAAVEADNSPADSEAILFGQAARIDESLQALGGASSPKPQAFFLGFAGFGAEKVFAEEIGLASRVLGERYGIGTRSVSLINDQRDLESAPLATVSGLKYALRGLGSRMSLDRDVLFLSISSHGAEDPAIVVANAELPLQDLTDEDLADALRDSGIKWRVIIISACYAGAFIDRLKDPQTIVITAAAADRTSFGCSNDRDLTYFGEAFYRDALPAARSLRNAFDTARAAIAARERREHVDASNPQAYFGARIEAKLAAMTLAEP